MSPATTAHENRKQIVKTLQTGGNMRLSRLRTALTTSGTYAAGLQEAVKQIAALDPWKS
jgi:ribosome maturation protein Sdo1